MSAPLAIMGGAFDPVHYGHLRTATELQEFLRLGELRFVPSANPPHRPPHQAEATVRVQMLKAASMDLPNSSVDERELRREGPSYSVLTLEELRAEQGDRSLCMILGMDAFLGLPHWHRWEELPELAHIVVACRPGSTLRADGPLGRLLAERATSDPADIAQCPAGRVLVHEVTQLEISSSAIRSRLQQQQSVDFLLPAAVLAIIQATGCYQAGYKYSMQERRVHAE